MQITVTGHHLNIGDALHQHIEQSLNDKIGKYFSEAISVQVIITKEAYFHCAEVIVHPGNKGLSIQARAKHNDIYPAFDEAADKIAKQLRRYKSRLKTSGGVGHADLAEALNDVDSASQTAKKIIFAGVANANDNEEENISEDPAVVAEMTTPIMTLTVSEAVMNLELGDYPALLFRNKGTGGYNMLYRRPDGNIGWVDPESKVS